MILVSARRSQQTWFRYARSDGDGAETARRRRGRGRRRKSTRRPATSRTGEGGAATRSRPLGPMTHGGGSRRLWPRCALSPAALASSHEPEVAAPSEETRY